MATKWSWCLLALILGTTWLRAGDENKIIDEARPIVERNLEYGKAGDMALKLDLYRPAKQTGKVPGVLVIHGGGWKGGNKESMGMVADQLARAGYVAASVQYRLTPKHRFPAQVYDVKGAVRWMRHHADKYQVNAGRIGAIGASAGGHLALMLGAIDQKDGLEGDVGPQGHSSKVQAVVNYFGPVDLTMSDWDPRIEPLLLDFLDGKLHDRRDAYRRASPITYLDARDAPTITFHGTRDDIVPYTHAILLDRTLRQKGVTSHLEVMIGSGHGWLGDDLAHTQKLAFQFLNTHLKEKVTPTPKNSSP